jgi:hypothetical protein
MICLSFSLDKASFRQKKFPDAGLKSARKNRPTRGDFFVGFGAFSGGFFVKISGGFSRREHQIQQLRGRVFDRFEARFLLRIPVPLPAFFLAGNDPFRASKASRMAVGGGSMVCLARPPRSGAIDAPAASMRASRKP